MSKHHIGKHLSITHRTHTKIIDKFFKKEFNLNYGQVFILSKIYVNDTINQHKLCEEYSLDKAGVGRILKKLERKDFIKRKSDPKDKRSNIIYLTEKSKRMKEDFFQLFDKIESQIRQDLSDEEIDTLINLLKKVQINLDTLEG
ncbi:MAG: MarR family transcriptional regulator [Halanaerobiales bacterium]|nr:MarR family transcriptional regulator [Halanaerobiales bacterium]